MTIHATLTPDERNDMLAFWRDYVLRGGTGEQPSAFAFDALNDPVIRDAFLFWHLGGNPFKQANSPWDPVKMNAAMDVMGPFPTDMGTTIKAMSNATSVLTDAMPDLDTIDTATVLVLSHVMLAMLLKKFNDAAHMIGRIIEVNVAAANNAGAEVLHLDPLRAIGTAVEIIKDVHEHVTDDGGTVDQMLKDVFCVERIPTLSNSDTEN